MVGKEVNYKDYSNNNNDVFKGEHKKNLNFTPAGHDQHVLL